MRSRTLTLLAATVSTGLVLTACGANSSDSGGTGSSSASSSAQAGGGANGKVGVILPETATSARWEAFDKPMLQAALSAQGFEADIQNAQGDSQKFSTLADGFISSGVKALIIAPSDPAVGAAVEAKAKGAGIPVIDYDRPSLGGSADYYVSFDNEKVGQLQGQGLADKLKDKPGAQVIQIEGAPTDNNATLFTNGQDKVLDPLFSAGTL
jgi:D-xylose transport system substrate-binding protein